ncbi:MAG: hypothetical protein EA341_01055 [Mongoliibacter sp.]|uniref:hypothetical protein n=1 Tax=Mongoliibacter sp. TaxID=2022438 RepID=UPI0012EFA5D9|nr:hypothetical protein [Mongoliibacter sp.]TVP53393.1 MAG: hypothetical protein EA341_01055 [Mongoliibacter sp.]
MDKSPRKKPTNLPPIPFVALFLLIAFSCNSNDPKNDPRFHGIWKLDIFESFDSISGTWSYWEYDKYQAGYILYDGKGEMADHLTSKDYLNLIVRYLWKA